MGWESEVGTGLGAKCRDWAGRVVLGLGWESSVGMGLAEWCWGWIGRVVKGLGWGSGVGTGLGEWCRDWAGDNGVSLNRVCNLTFHLPSVI